MSTRRRASRHQTVASSQHEAVRTEDYWICHPDASVMTIDGLGKVTAVHDGPFPGSEEYEIALHGGKGGGRYTSSQITAVLPSQSLAHATEATTKHTAGDDSVASLHPRATRQDVTDGLVTDSVDLGKTALFASPSGVHGAYLSDLTGSQAQPSSLGEAPGLGPHTASSILSVAHVVANRPQYEVCREVHTRVDIAGMPHVHLARLTNEVSVRPAMGLHHAWMEGGGVGAVPEVAIAQAGRGSRPEPAICVTCAFDLAPETVLDRLPGATAADFLSAADHVCSLAGHWYPELAEIIAAKPNPGTMTYAASLRTAADAGGMTGGGLDGMTSGPITSTTDGDGPVGGEPSPRGGVVAWDPGEYNDAMYHDWREAALSHNDGDPDKVYLRFGKWRDDERSDNNVTGGKEDGVSVYELDRHGDPMDPDPHMQRGVHDHEDYGCDDGDCDIPKFDEDFGNDTKEEMQGRVYRAERAARQGQHNDHPDVGHLVKGEHVSFGHDDEPLLKNVKRVGDWIDHRHHFIPTAEPHHLARHPDDEDYEPYHGEPQQMKLFGSLHVTATYDQIGNSHSSEIADSMQQHGPDGDGYAHQGDGGTYCPSCAKGMGHEDHDGPLTPLSWSDLRKGGGPEGESCSDCQRELTPPRAHTLSECSYGEDCESANEAHDENLKRAEQRDFLKRHPERFIGNDDVEALHEDRDWSVDHDPHTDPPLHLADHEGQDDHWGSPEDHALVQKAHQDWGNTLKQRDHDSHSAEDQINSLFSGPEFAAHKDFLEGNTKGPTHLSVLKLAGETWHPEHLEPDDIRKHLIEHHGEHPDYLGWSVENHHDQLHEPDEERWDHEDPDHSHHDTSREWSPAPWEGRERSGGSTQSDPERSVLAPLGGTDYKPVPRTIQSLNLLRTAALDPSFAFHVLAAWRDVQSKAIRIRRSGGVSITHSSDGYVIGNVKGDHNVYETGIQRVPGRRTAIAVYSCGCKWGSYHWGADDDLSRYAGRVCSHALALQYEAQSRGMFGRDIEVDDTRPRWVPSKVVVKYDIDNGTNIHAQARLVPEQSPLMVVLSDPETLRKVTAAVGDPFGGDAGIYNEPAYANPLGATSPRDPNINPTSAGPFTTGEPENWGSINGPSMYPGTTASLHATAWLQALIPIVRALAPKVIKTVAPAVADAAAGAAISKGTDAVSNMVHGTEDEEQGTKAMLHDEPQGALPSTDGEEHTASLGDLGTSGDSHLGDIDMEDGEALSPINQSIQAQGAQTSPGVQSIVEAFQATAAAQGLSDTGGAPGAPDSSGDLAAAARAHLAKTAGSTFTAAEQNELINESPGVQASNTDRLEIEGTHYASLTDESDDSSWLM